MTRRISFTAAALFIVLACWSVPARTAGATGYLDCVVATRERGDTMTPPSAAALRQAAHAVERIAKADAAFMAGNRRPIRVRTTIDAWRGTPHGAIINTVAYTQKAWVRGACDVIPQADRGGDLSEGAIHVILNDPYSFLTARLGDHDFEAFEEPVRTGEFAGFPIYDQLYVLISRTGKVPWVPVTVADALRFEEARMKRRFDEWTAEKQRPSISLASIETSYQAMRKIDPEAAEKTRAALVNVMQDEKIQRAKMEADHDARLARQAVAWAAYRAALTPAQLQAQARLGVVGADQIVRVDDPNGRRLVKADPALATLPPGEVHLIRVFRGDWPKDPVEGRTEWMRRTNDTLDFAALARLAGR